MRATWVSPAGLPARFAAGMCFASLLLPRAPVASTAWGQDGIDLAQTSREQYDHLIAPLFKQHCVECHGAEKPEGEIELLTLDPDMKASTSAARWAVVLEKVVTGEMPPEDEPRLTAEEVQAVSRWIHAELKRAGKHVARRAEYANGNKVPHELLFDPQQSAPFDVPARARRLSPEIYDAFTKEVGKDAPGVSQPFSPEGRTTFKDMGAPQVDEPITALLIRNALAMVDRHTAHKLENGELKAVGFVPKEFLRLFDEQRPVTDEELHAAIQVQFDRVLKRKPTDDELAKFTALFHKTIADAGREVGVKYSLAAVYLLPEAIFRWELGGGEVDEQGRVRLAPREIAFAIAYALTDKRPDGWLLAEAKQGKLDTREGVEAAVRKMLDDPKLDKPRIMRFFREYFGYGQAQEIFKDDQAFAEHDARALVEDTDRLVQYILEQDKDVLRELLTTNKSFVAFKKAADTKKKRIEALAKFEEEKRQNPEKFKNKKPPKVDRSVYEAYNLTDFPDEQPVELPKDQRAGILTQPAWLVAQSKSDENHVIFRGKWVRERLLGNVVPDIPITVDAQLPIAPEKTLRQRVAVTEEEYCWQCHRLMNRVGLPFEQYDHFGRYRTTEPVFDAEATAKNVDPKGKHLGPVLREIPVDASGGFEHTDDAKLTGDVKNAVELMQRMAESERVEQVFVRHAFRYWMGRNETLGDAASLQAAHKAFREGGGSMNALITSLVTSDSFLYRVSSGRVASTETPE